MANNIPLNVSDNSTPIPLSVRSADGTLSLNVNTYLPTVYDGTYTVTPILYETQTLNTKNKLLEDDISVSEIPVTRTSNLQGGLTVLIG